VGGTAVPQSDTAGSDLKQKIKRRMGHGMPGMTIDEIKDELGVGQGSCLLGCGELRADCFREGGTREERDQADRECTWECFAGSGGIA
jgi:hypothetical protein